MNTQAQQEDPSTSGSRGYTAQSSSSSPPSSSNKRSRVTTACLQCQRRKSRCDVILSGGCGRCRQLRTQCSLRASESEERETLAKLGQSSRMYSIGAGASGQGPAADINQLEGGPYLEESSWNTGLVPPNDRHSRHPASVTPDYIVSSTDAAMNDPLADITNRMSRMESMLSSLVSASSSRMSNSSTPRSIPALDDPHPEGPRGEETIRANLESVESMNEIAKGGWGSILGCLMGVPANGYLDVVEMGFIDDKEFESVWKLFKPIFVTIYPFDIFLDSRSPPPSHALLRCAVLYYTWRAVSPNTINLDAADAKELERLVEYNVGLTSMVEPDEEAILALVILSQTCTRENAKFLKVEDPFGAGAAAHRMSVTIGLEESIERCAQEPVEYMSESWNRPMIDRVCLYYAVYHRVLWSTIYVSPTILPKRLEHESLLSFISPMTAVFMGDRMLIHLVFEAQIFDLVRPVAAELRSSRTCRIYDPSTDERLYARVIDSINGFERWRRDVTAAKMSSSPALILASHLLESMVLLKISMEQRMRLPSPLIVQGGDLLPNMGGLLLSHAPQVTQRIIADQTDFARLPARYILLTLPCTMIIARVGKMKDSWVATHPIFASLQELGEVARLMGKACPPAARLIELIKATSPPTRYEPPDGQGDAQEELCQRSRQDQGHVDAVQPLLAGIYPPDMAVPDVMRDFAADSYFGYPFDFSFDFDMADVQMAMASHQAN